MPSRAELDVLVRDLTGARTLFEEGLVPDELDALLVRLDQVQLDGLQEIPEMVRGLVEEGPLLASYPLLAASMDLFAIRIRLFLMESGRH
jgi:hypothetical protein